MAAYHDLLSVASEVAEASEVSPTASLLMSSAGMDCFKSVVNSLNCATSTPAAAERIREFFDLDEHDAEGHGEESLESMLKDFIQANSPKRPLVSTATTIL